MACELEIPSFDFGCRCEVAGLFSGASRQVRCVGGRGGFVDVAVTSPDREAADQLRSLYAWMSETEELRGRVGRRERPPELGTLGPALDGLAVALGPGGVATAFATAVIAWLRSRSGEVRLKVQLGDSESVELTAKRVSGLDAAALGRQVTELADLLGRHEDRPGPPEAR